MMDSRMRGNSHVRLGVGEIPEITSTDYLSLYYHQGCIRNLLVYSFKIEFRVLLFNRQKICYTG